MTTEIKPINMPKWGMEMSEGDINAWYFAVGDQVNAGDDTKQCANGMGFALSADNCSENSATGCGDRIDNLAGFYIN